VRVEAAISPAKVAIPVVVAVATSRAKVEVVAVTSHVLMVTSLVKVVVDTNPAKAEAVAVTSHARMAIVPVRAAVAINPVKVVSSPVKVDSVAVDSSRAKVAAAAGLSRVPTAIVLVRRAVTNLALTETAPHAVAVSSRAPMATSPARVVVSNRVKAEAATNPAKVVVVSGPAKRVAISRVPMVTGLPVVAVAVAAVTSRVRMATDPAKTVVAVAKFTNPGASVKTATSGAKGATIAGLVRRHDPLCPSATTPSIPCHGIAPVIRRPKIAIRCGQNHGRRSI
jgi:hypothetical protein